MLVGDQVPARMSRGSVIGQEPSIIIVAPKAENRKRDISSVISFSTIGSRWKLYATNMRNRLISYRDAKVNKIDLFNCETKAGYRNKSIDDYKRSCYYNTSSSSETTGFGSCNCDASCRTSNFGYDIGEPCVAIALTKSIDWRPAELPNGNYEDIFDCEKGTVHFECSGKTDIDREHFDKVNVYPSRGITFCFYPFYNAPSYQQPFVMIKLIGAKRGVLIQITCYANLTKIKHNDEYEFGLMNLNFLIKR